MNPILRDLLGHLYWADALLWNAAAAHAPARDDKAVRGRLHHIHLVQRAFVWAVKQDGTRFAPTKPEDFGSFDDLRAFARESHQQIRQFLSSAPGERVAALLADPVSVPWFKDPPLTVTIAEALTQMTMHSHWHRAQNATRLRELGGDPPPTDLIVWYWKGRPAAPAW